MTDRKRPGVAFWMAVGLVVAMLAYPLSIGPCSWLAWQPWCPLWLADSARRFHTPTLWLIENSPEPVSDAIGWYIMLWR